MMKGRLEVAIRNKTLHVEAVFDEIKPKIIEEIQTAQTSISIAIALFTDDEIINTLASRARDGLAIRIILYEDVNNNKAIAALKNESNISLYTFPHRADYGGNPLMHNKFALFDNKSVLTGSYNWTKSAMNNIENVVIIYDEGLAVSFANQFMLLVRSPLCKEVE